MNNNIYISDKSKKRRKTFFHYNNSQTIHGTFRYLIKDKLTLIELGTLDDPSDGDEKEDEESVGVSEGHNDVNDGDSNYEDEEDPDDIPYPGLTLQRNPNPNLPETVTILETEDGGKVYVVGTAHFSHSSQEDVAKVNIY